MKFSDVFGVTLTPTDDWFDPVLSIDTPLFIDPFLIFDNEDGAFVGSHAEIIKYFDYALKQLATSNGDSTSIVWQRVEALMLFPEVEELCLGFAAKDTHGAGSRKGFAARITSALWKAIDLGKEDLRHFEQVQLFQKGIGRDRISDATAIILRNRFASYTAEVAERHTVPTSLARFDRAVFSLSDGRWKGQSYLLPKNRYTGKHVLLAPKHFLRDLPTLNKDDFWDYCVHNENDMLRDMFGAEILRKADAAAIVKIALEQPGAREGYVKYREATGSDPYDLLTDPHGFVGWYEKSQEWVSDHPMTLAARSQAEFRNFVRSLIDVFRNWVENNRGWTHFWNDNRTAKGKTRLKTYFWGL